MRPGVVNWDVGDDMVLVAEHDWSVPGDLFEVYRLGDGRRTLIVSTASEEAAKAALRLLTGSA